MIENSIKRIVTGRWKENCYIISNSTGESILIDPGNNEDIIEDYILANELKLCAILNTHAHMDHIGAIEYFKNKYQIPFFIHSGDEKLLKNANLYVKIFDGSGSIKIPQIDFFFDRANPIDLITTFHVKIIHTPGHTLGSVCILINDALFTGDTLFSTEIGRTDLPGGNKQKLKDSLRKIAKMPKNTIIYPGHGAALSLKEILMSNEQFKKALV